MPSPLPGPRLDALRTLHAQKWLLDTPDAPPTGGMGDEVAPHVDADQRPLPTFFIGVDLGGTKIHAAGLFFEHGVDPILVESFDETDPRGGLDIVRQIGLIAQNLIVEVESRREDPQGEGAKERGFAPVKVSALALGCPGVVDPETGYVSHAPNLPGWDVMDIPAALAAELNCPIQVDNDVDIAARGEQVWTGTEDVAFVSLGTGIGMGLILDGQIRKGAGSQAGEICHIPLGSDPYDRTLQNHGVLESRLSGVGLLADHHALGGSAADVREIFALAANGEQMAQDSLHATADLLALTIRTVAAVVDPGVFVLGGGIGARPEVLSLTTASLERTGGPSITVRSSAFGSRAGVAGALAAALFPSISR